MRAQTPLVRKPTGFMANVLNNNTGDNDAPEDNEDDFEEETILAQPSGIHKVGSLNISEPPSLDMMIVKIPTMINSQMN